MSQSKQEVEEDKHSEIDDMVIQSHSLHHTQHNDLKSQGAFSLKKEQSKISGDTLPVKNNRRYSNNAIDEGLSD